MSMKEMKTIDLYQLSTVAVDTASSLVIFGSSLQLWFYPDHVYCRLKQELKLVDAKHPYFLRGKVHGMELASGKSYL